MCLIIMKKLVKTGKRSIRGIKKGSKSRMAVSVVSAVKKIIKMTLQNGITKIDIQIELEEGIVR